MTKNCKLTILKTTVQEDLMKEYGVPTLTACTAMHEGQVFYTDKHRKPDGFCDEAWKAIYQYVFALCHGVDVWYTENWIDKKHKNVAICSCNDGLRPVIIKVEAIDE